VIVIVAESGDVHARRVADLLGARGQPVSCVHAADFGRAAALSFDPTSGDGHLTIDGTVISTADVSAVWYRRPGRPRAVPDITDPLDRAFAESEWQHAIDGFFTALAGRVVSPPLRQRAAIKPLQLAAARAAGLRVPATLVTNDVDEALTFVDGHADVVHKAMSAPPHRFLDTRVWGALERSRAEDLPLCPVVLQERIDGPSDVRVTIAGRRVLAARFDRSPHAQGPDSRLDTDATCVPCTLPDSVTAALLAVLDRLGLLFGTVDLKVTDAGEHVFLEVNPQGQFLYVEILTGLPISATVADLLEDGP
jgi:hypothetical protein